MITHSLYYQPSSYSFVNYAAVPGLKREVVSTSMEQIIADVAAAFEIEPETLYRKCRYPRIKFARWMVWKIMRSKKYSLRECSQIFGNYDHTSVINALSKIDNDIEKDEMVRQAFNQVKKYMGNKKNKII